MQRKVVLAIEEMSFIGLIKIVKAHYPHKYTIIEINSDHITTECDLLQCQITR